MIKLIASDLDGTLLRDGALEVAPDTIELIKELKEQGILFVAASGRQYPSICNLFSSIKDEIAYIAENGSLAIYNGKILSKTIIDRELSQRIIEAFRCLHMTDFIVSGEQTLYTESTDPAFLNLLLNDLKTNTVAVNDVIRDINEPFLKIAVYVHTNMEEAQKRLRDLFESEIKIVTAGNRWIDFIAPGTNKGIALSAMMEHLHISADECMAFGDQYNDVEMLQAAGTSYAMTTAAPGVSAYSTYTTDSVDDVLRKLLK
jgi:Cof subfamily protein (haloacid dehalogenase superfamily)